MPFDGVSNGLWKLQALLELLPRSTDQGDYHTCLWSEARKYKPFLEAGLSINHLNLAWNGFPDEEKIAAFFGITGNEVVHLFDESTEKEKERFLKRLIKQKTR